MRQLFRELACLLLMLAVTMVAAAQAEQTRVTLKSGVTVVGTLKDFDPTSHIEIEVGGHGHTHRDGERAEHREGRHAAVCRRSSPADSSCRPAVCRLCRRVAASRFAVRSRHRFRRFAKDENGEYRRRGRGVRARQGRPFSYGYDGIGSRNVESEPVHDITLSSFYVTKYPVKQGLVKAVMGIAPLEGFNMKPYTKSNNSNKGTTPQASIDEDNRDVMFFNAVERGEDIMNFRALKLKLAETLPAATKFLSRCREKAGLEDLEIITEAQWAYVRTRNNDMVTFPFMPEVVRSVSMHTANDPVGGQIMLKGVSHYTNNGWVAVKVTGVQSRLSIPLHDIDEDDKDLDIGDGDMCIAPMHLVLPAK